MASFEGWSHLRTVLRVESESFAYSLLTLFRSVTQRSDDQRAVPWPLLLRDVLLTLVAATDDQLDGLRPRAGPPPPPD